MKTEYKVTWHIPWAVQSLVKVRPGGYETRIMQVNTREDQRVLFRLISKCRTGCHKLRDVEYTGTVCK